MRAVTNLGVIENAGPNHLRGFLRQHIKTASKVDIAVAFVTRAGLKELLLVLKKVAMSGRVRLLTGLYQCFTEPEALRALLAVQRDTKDQFLVRLSANDRFHWKSYFLFKGKSVTAVIGSSNLTADGLGGSGELNAVVSVYQNSVAFRTMHNPFDDEWEQAFTLNKKQIDLYAKARPKIVMPQPSIPLRKILGRQTKKRQIATEPLNRQYWRDWIGGYAKTETNEIISEATNWDDRGYDWYSSREPRHHRGDRIVLFDSTNRRVSVVEVIATTHTPRSTPDGRRFTAYKQLPHSHMRKIGNSLFAELKKAGLVIRQSEIKSARKLNAKIYDRFKKAMKS